MMSLVDWVLGKRMREAEQEQIERLVPTYKTTLLFVTLFCLILRLLA